MLKLPKTATTIAIPIFANKRYNPMSLRLKISEEKTDSSRTMMNSAKKEIWYIRILRIRVKFEQPRSIPDVNGRLHIKLTPSPIAVT